MNVKRLIDAIVRQNMVLVAQLSTTAGIRAPLAHVANEVFLSLVDELESQGVRQRVIADMFGLALRSYQRKVQRLSESRTDAGRSLWEAVLSHVAEHEVVQRAEVLRRFRYDDEAMVKGVLDDLVSTGLLYRRGRRDATVYRYVAEAEADAATVDDAEADDAMVWLEIYRTGPLARAELLQQLHIEAPRLEASLARLTAEGRVSEADGQFASSWFFSDYDAEAGWEAALFDHYQAVVTSLCAKLALGATHAERRDELGGSTYTFDVWRGHPFDDRVRSLLRRQREELDTLIADVRNYNEQQGRPARFDRVTFYVGQSVRFDDEQEGDE